MTGLPLDLYHRDAEDAEVAQREEQAHHRMTGETLLRSGFHQLLSVVPPTMLKAASHKITFLPASPSRWADLESLFGARGACGGCWCMFWRLPRKDFELGKGAGNKRSLSELVRKGRKPGVIAYQGTQPIGWCAVAPRAHYLALERSRILKPVDDLPVWSISCLFVKKEFRRQGLSSKLLRAAADFAAKQGARIVEGYPTEPAKNTPDPFLWHGVASAFVAAGFKEVVRRSKTRPIMRLMIDK